MNYLICGVEEIEKEALAELRVLSMRESLEAIGRFDPAMARRRFIDGFDSRCTHKIVIEGELAGFYVLRDKGNHLYLDHLYVHPKFQGNGIGSSVLATVIMKAKDRRLPLRLGALRGSRSNEFYLARGFVQTHESEWDIYYELHS